jgi:hypothetical protein
VEQARQADQRVQELQAIKVRALWMNIIWVLHPYIVVKRLGAAQEQKGPGCELEYYQRIGNLLFLAGKRRKTDRLRQAETDRRPVEIWTLRAGAGIAAQKPLAVQPLQLLRASLEEVEEQAAEQMEVIAVAVRVRGGGGEQQAAWMRSQNKIRRNGSLKFWKHFSPKRFD